MLYNEDEEEVTEEEEVEDESSEEEGEEGGGGGLLGGLLGGAGIGGIVGGIAETVGEQLKSGEGFNIGQMIDDATEDKGGVIKAAGDMIGGFLNRDKGKDDDSEDEE
jgi:hypothetical protein